MGPKKLRRKGIINRISLQENVFQLAVIRKMENGKLQISESNGCACTPSTNNSSCRVTIGL